MSQGAFREYVYVKGFGTTRYTITGYRTENGQNQASIRETSHGRGEWKPGIKTLHPPRDLWVPTDSIYYELENK